MNKYYQKPFKKNLLVLLVLALLLMACEKKQHDKRLLGNWSTLIYQDPNEIQFYQDSLRLYEMGKEFYGTWHSKDHLIYATLSHRKENIVIDTFTLAYKFNKDTLLIKVKPVGPVCHTGADTCFDEKNTQDAFLFYLEKVIQERKNNPSEKSYTASLFQKGINKIAQKVGEEAVELVIESKDDDDELFMGEAADLVYHFLVLLAAKNKNLSSVVKVLETRHKPK